jgi:hypothetical protein
MPQAGSIEGMDLGEYFVYYGREDEIIPKDVIRVKVHPSAKAIKYRAFENRKKLTTVILNDGLEEIEQWAFYNCTSLQGIVAPPTVKSIKKGAFQECTGLMTATLHDGLEEIGEMAFHMCTSLLGMEMPPSIEVIEYQAFSHCSKLLDVVLGDGVKEIRRYAFWECISLEHIEIAPAIRAIHCSAFKGCSQLKRVALCDEIEEFATCEAMRGWWNQGIHRNLVHQPTLTTYHFLFRCSIPKRLGDVPLPFQAIVYEMLRCIPSKSDWSAGLDAHLDSIDSKLTLCKLLLEEVSPILELAIWILTRQGFVHAEDIILNIFTYLI